MFTPVYIIAGIVAFCAFAALQFWASKNGLSRSVKNMTLFISLTMFFLSLMIYSGALGGEGSTIEGFKSSEIYGLAFGMISLCALVGDIAALLVFKMTHKKPEPPKKNSKKKKK